MNIEFFFIVLGLAIGSFINVCIIRLPANQSIVLGRSHCMKCGVQIRVLDLIPIFSYLRLKGRCRFCNAKFSSRYFFVEFFTCLIFFYLYVTLGISNDLVKILILLSYLIVITFIDIDHQLILDKVLIWLAGTGVIINLFIGTLSVVDMLIAALAGGGLMLLIAVVSRGGMGGGDIKFMAALGLWLGWKLTLLTLFLGFVLGGISGGLFLLLKIKGRKDFIPFGPFLAIGAFISLLYGNELIRWYVTNFL